MKYTHYPLHSLLYNVPYRSQDPLTNKFKVNDFSSPPSFVDSYKLNYLTFKRRRKIYYSDIKTAEDVFFLERIHVFSPLHRRDKKSLTFAEHFYLNRPKYINRINDIFEYIELTYIKPYKGIPYKHLPIKGFYYVHSPRPYDDQYLLLDFSLLKTDVYDKLNRLINAKGVSVSNPDNYNIVYNYFNIVVALKDRA